MHYTIPGYVRRFHELNTKNLSYARRSVLDVGGRNVNGSISKVWRELGFTYYAADVSADHVPIPTPYDRDWDDGGIDFFIPAQGDWDLGVQFEVVFSTSTIEHVKEPWELVRTMARHVRPGGWLFLTAPFMWPEHRYPEDCWRFAPDGMRHLFNIAGIQVKESGLSRELFWGPRAVRGFRPFLRWITGQHASHVDCWAWGQKPGGEK